MKKYFKKEYRKIKETINKKNPFSTVTYVKTSKVTGKQVARGPCGLEERPPGREAPWETPPNSGAVGQSLRKAD